MPGIEGAEVGTERALSVPRNVLAARLFSTRAIPFALALVTFLVFLPVLWNGFVEWDDQITFYQNEHYRGLGWAQIRWMFSNVLMGHYIPLTWLTLGLDYVNWGMNPAGYHLTSLLLYAANAAAFYFVALRLLQTATSLAGATLRVGATAATLFFALHPLRVESVAWATERRDVLSGLFFLLTILAYLKACGEAGASRRRLVAVAVGLYVLALASKASVMGLPFVLILLDVYPLRRLGGSWREWTGAAARGVWIEKIPFLVLGVAGGAVTYYAQNANMFITTLQRYPLSARIGMTFYSLWFYVEKTVLPQGLSPLYELPARVNLLERRFLLPAIIVTLITVVLVAARRRWPAGLAVWVYYAIALGPVIGIVHSGHQLTNDRYGYLPGFGLALLLGAAAGAAARAAAAGTLRPALVKAMAGAGALWVVGLSILTVQQVQIWHDTESLWRYALESDPRCAICYANLGLTLGKQGDHVAARKLFERALEVRPDSVISRPHLGVTLAMQGDFAAAVEHYSVYLARYPNDPDVLNNMGAALLGLKRPKDAIECLQRALQIKPKHVLAHANLGFAFADLDRPGEALAYYRRAIELKPSTPQPWFGLAREQYRAGRIDAAFTAYGILSMLSPELANRIAPAFIPTW